MCEVSLISVEWDVILKVRAPSVESMGSLVVDELGYMTGVGKNINIHVLPDA